MEFKPEDRDRITPFQHTGRLPSPAVYARALSLIGSAPIVSTFTDRVDEAQRTALTLWVLLPKSIIRVHGVGPGGWDEPRYQEPDEIEADLWPLARLGRVSIGNHERWTGFADDVSWTSQIEIGIDDDVYKIPSATGEDVSFRREALDEFIAALMTAMNA